MRIVKLDSGYYIESDGKYLEYFEVESKVPCRINKKEFIGKWSGDRYGLQFMYSNLNPGNNISFTKNIQDAMRFPFIELAKITVKILKNKNDDYSVTSIYELN